MLKLKDYQERALEALQAYLRACVQFGNADLGYPGSYGKFELFDVDLTKVGSGYPTK